MSLLGKGGGNHCPPSSPPYPSPSHSSENQSVTGEARAASNHKRKFPKNRNFRLLHCITVHIAKKPLKFRKFRISPNCGTCRNHRVPSAYISAYRAASHRKRCPCFFAVAPDGRVRAVTASPSTHLDAPPLMWAGGGRRGRRTRRLRPSRPPPNSA